ncbi:MAG: molybdopterin-dependent oxidoreductase [Endozoicomonas sp.]
MTTNVVQTTCAYCGVGCGINARITDPELHLVEIQGQEDHPANFGRLCSKGSALGETVSLENRLLTPYIGQQQVGWTEALDQVTERLRETIEQYGPDSVALYGSGQLLTEDYYVANKLMKGFIGSANIDTNSRLCMASTVAGQKRAFGSDTVPGSYEDLELADLLVLVGSNTAWCHPVLFQRIRAAKERRPDMKVVVIDPRRTDSCDIADLHLPLKPGTDVALFNGLLSWLADQEAVDQDFVSRFTNNFNQALFTARRSASSITEVAEICDLDSAELELFFSWFTQTGKTVTAWSQGVNQSVAGTDKVNAIINCHLATGRIGRPGSGPLSLTGQPNAMGGREVGGLANQLAAHMDFSDPGDIDRVRRFWNAAKMASAPGKTAVDLFEAVERGDIRFVWIMGTNPVVSMPNAGQVRRALSQCPTVVVSDCIELTDTSEYAHIRLPAAGWGEKDGTVTNSERRISRQRSLFPLSGESKPDWWILSQVGKRLGYGQAFDYSRPAEIFSEHAALSAFENDGLGKLRDFNIGAVSWLTSEQYDALDPFQWPLPPGVPVGGGDQRLFAEGGFYTDDRRARFVATDFVSQKNQPGDDYPLLLNTGRVRDHWHTMTRTGLSPRLSQHIDEPFIQVNPADADRYGLAENDLCRVTSGHGSAVVRAKVVGHIKEGNVFMPMHWTRRNSRTGHTGLLVNPETDPYSRQPDFKHSPVRIEPCKVPLHGLLISRLKQRIDRFDYATEVKAVDCFRYELAGEAIEEQCIEVIGSDKERIDYLDPVSGIKRSAWFAHGRLQAVLLVCEKQEALQNCDRAWLQQAFQQEDIPFADRWRVLAGMPPTGEDAGKVVCACFGVGEKSICRAIEQEGYTDTAQIGKALKAGTNCGSCLPELRRLIDVEERSESA